MIIFETERLRVRTLQADDYENFFRLQGDPEVMRFIRPVKTREESDAILDEMLRSPEPELGGRWMVEEKKGNTFAGTFALIPLPYDTAKMQLGYAFIPSAWGKGYATELTIAGLAYCQTKTSLKEIYAITEIPNIASQRVLQKAGFHLLLRRDHEGKPLLVYTVKW